MNKKVLMIIGGLLGIAFLIFAFLYFTTPAQNLPGFFPGYEAGVAKTHFKHGLGMIILALASFAFAWFQSGKKKSS